MKIRLKIVLPYTLLFSIVIIAVSLVTLSLIYKRMDERIEGQMDRAADVISSMNFILSDDFLKNIRISEVTGAEVILYRSSDEVIATTLSRDSLNELMMSINSEAGGKSLVKINYQGQQYKVAYRPFNELDKSGYATLALMVSTSDIDLAKRQSAITISIIAISGILLITAIGSIIAISITAPVKKLLEMTEKVASGDLDVRSMIKTHDEIGMLALSFDQMAEELKVSRDRLVQSERLAAIGQLSASVAHEIRNPLTSMKMILQLLKRKVDDEKTVQIVLDEIDRIDIIVSGLLDFARNIELTLKLTNIKTVIDDVLRIMESNLRHRKIDIAKYIDPMPDIMLDENRMKQVFMNLILNSMQAMPNGGTITISCKYSERSVCIEVSDNGTGMTQDVLVHAFEPFFSAKSGGTGMGLSNVKRIIEQHGGNIKIESEENKGTKVTIIMETGEEFLTPH